MSRMLTKTYLIILIAALLMLCGIVSASADSAVNRLKKKFRHQNTVKEQKQELLKLTREERSMFGELATIEDRISNVERELFQKEDDLAGIMEDEQATKADQRVLEGELDEIVAN